MEIWLLTTTILVPICFTILYSKQSKQTKVQKRKKRINMFKVLKIFDLDTRLVRFINQGRIKQKNTNAFLVDASAKGGGGSTPHPPPFLNLIKSNTNKIINISSYLKLPKCKELD